MSLARTGAGACARSLAGFGVDTVFSLSGDQVLPLYHELARADIRIAHARHESRFATFVVGVGQKARVR
jgi:acetolactate synthase I/II/III large subunit